MPLSQAIRYLLESCDEKGLFEFPSSFDETEVEQRAKSVMAEITKLGVSAQFEGFDSIQDALFGLQIVINEYDKPEGNISNAPFLRFSNFGNLVSLNGRGMIPQPVLKLILRSISRNGFNYVPEEELYCPYDGVMAGHKDIPTWWCRYFSWL